MREFKIAIGQLIVGVFFTLLTFPVLLNEITIKESDEIIGGTTKRVAEILWLDRLPEIYFHAIFLGVAIIASMLVIRKPPQFLKEGEK